jgi:hypothetical protein
VETWTATQKENLGKKLLLCQKLDHDNKEKKIQSVSLYPRPKNCRVQKMILQ